MTTKRPRMLFENVEEEAAVGSMDYLLSGLQLDRQEPYEDFPVYFGTLYPHMALIRQSKGHYIMMPPNQLDWHFEIRLDIFQADVWYVLGVKEDMMDELSYKYIKKDNSWEGVPYYP